MPLVTFDDRKVDLLSQISLVSETTTGNSNSTQTHYFDITGNGFIVVTASVRTDSTSDYGSTFITIFHNGTVAGYSYNRYATTTTEQQGGSGTVTLQVSNGDVIQVNIQQTKNGTKTYWWSCLSFGCTASYR